MALVTFVAVAYRNSDHQQIIEILNVNRCCQLEIIMKLHGALERAIVSLLIILFFPLLGMMMVLLFFLFSPIPHPKANFFHVCLLTFLDMNTRGGWKNIPYLRS